MLVRVAHELFHHDVLVPAEFLDGEDTRLAGCGALSFQVAVDSTALRVLPAVRGREVEGYGGFKRLASV